MITAYKPATHNSVSPYLIVNGAQRTIDFLKQVFNAQTIRQFLGDNGQVIHAEVRIDDTVVMIADSTENWPSAPAHIHVYVVDVDATYQRALEAGAISVQLPSVQGDEDKRGGVKDASGVTWWIATKVH